MFTQEYRVLYEYQFKNDSTKLDVVEKEIMVLDTDENGSVFYSYPKFYYDSVAVEKSKINEFPDFTNKAKIQFYIEKINSGNEALLHTKLGVENLVVSDLVNLDWKISDEKRKIKEYTVQKATTNFGGRSWTAWFCTEIPIFYGPYKFSGLPGLILTLEDLNSHHRFDMIGIEKNSDGKANFLKMNGRKLNKISKKEFNKIWHEYKKDPAKSTKFLLLNSNTGMKLNYDGKDYNVKDMIKNAEEMELNKIKSHNNFIELDLYK